MTGILLILALALFTIFYTAKEGEDDIKLPPKLTEQLDRMWDIAQKAFSERKFLRAEKALLTILRFDETNATAYNRLGILYARQKQYKEAIECFEVAQSLDSNANSLHNAGLIYLETGENEKASMAFEQALALEDNLPTRYIAYSKALEGLGEYKKAISALEASLELNKSVQVYRQLAHLYETSGDQESADKINKTLEKLAEKRATATLKKAAKIRPGGKNKRKVVM
ncbi:MAG: tetratricopeptide repeat protein [Candidatus Nomurabacteria bacterium]|jgi:tetratricopeptide (TPR) repeat protein|nr:tetratricopeptide repeat protein [Candidatus Nomurabacteria bacterium]